MFRLLGIEPRIFFALVRSFILMDLRGQHYASATASKPAYVLSPLFIVVGQMLVTSTCVSGYLHTRADVFFFAFANLSVSLLLMATALVVEFQEVALNPADLAIIGHRPIPPRTYAAARFANLLFYFGLMFLAQNLIPAISGASLPDAGWLYLPAYVAAALGGTLVLVAVLVGVLAGAGQGPTMQTVRAILSWAQIALLAATFYGGLLLARGGFGRLLVWGAFPPAYVAWIPSAWLARFVERACYAPDLATVHGFLTLAALSGASCVFVVLRLSVAYRDLQPVEIAAGRARPMPPSLLGRLPASWLARGPEERAGYWLATTFLTRDAALAMRCLFSFNVPLLAGAFGVLSGQLGDPMTETDPRRVVLTLAAVFLLPISAPALVFNLAYCKDSAGGWLLRTAPVARPLGLATGACKAVQVWVVTPLAVILGGAAWLIWGDPLSAGLHALLAWSLTWVFILASLWLVAPALPFSLPPPRGAGLALPPLPLLVLSSVAAALAAAHLALAPYPAYWLALLAVVPLAGYLAHRQAARWMHRLGRAD